MKTIENVFISVENEETVVYSLLKNIPVFNIYIIFSNSDGKMEITSSSSFFRRKDFESLYVLGIAEGKYTAYKIVREMLDYSVKHGWEADKTGICLTKENSF